MKTPIQGVLVVISVRPRGAARVRDEYCIKVVRLLRQYGQVTLLQLSDFSFFQKELTYELVSTFSKPFYTNINTNLTLTLTL